MNKVPIKISTQTRYGLVCAARQEHDNDPFGIIVAVDRDDLAWLERAFGEYDNAQKFLAELYREDTGTEPQYSSPGPMGPSGPRGGPCGFGGPGPQGPQSPWASRP